MTAAGTSAPRAGKPDVFRNVQALRAIAALLIVGVHLGNNGGFEARYLSQTPIVTRIFAEAGWYGVDLFFVISGFIMTVTSWQLFGSSPNALQFLLRRVARIYPAYWALLLPLLALYLIRPDMIDSHSAMAPNLLASFLLLPQAGDSLLLVAWTLVYEMAFYLVFTFALIFNRRWLPLILTFWVAGIIYATLNWPSAQNPYMQFAANPLPLEFVCGIVAGAFVMKKNYARPELFLGAGLVIVGGVMAYAIATASISSTNPWIRPIGGGAGFAALLYGVVGIEKRYGVLFYRWLDTLGDASYAMYLWHVPVLTALGLVVVRWHPAGLAAHLVFVALAIALVVAVALFVHRFIERPLTKFAQRHLAFGLRRTVTSRSVQPATAAD